MNIVDERAGSERLVRWGTPTIRSSRAHVARAVALAFAFLGVLVALSLAPSVRASPPRSFYNLTVYIDQQHSPEIALRFYLDSFYEGPTNVTNSPYEAERIDLTANASRELTVDGTAGARWSDFQLNVLGDTNFTQTVQISSSTLATIAANPGSTVFASVNVTIVYTDDVGAKPRTIFRAVTFALNYQPPGTIEFAGAAIAGLGGAGAIGLALYVGRRAKLEELFLMHNSGTLIRRWSAANGHAHDADAVSGMLVVLQEFVRDSFDDRTNNLEQLRFGKQRVILVRGQHTIFAAVVHGRFLNDLPGRLQQSVWEFESSYADVLPRWDGDVNRFTRIDFLAQRFLRARRGPMVG